MRTWLGTIAAAVILVALPAGAAQPKTPPANLNRPKGEIKDENGAFVIRYSAVVPKDIPPGQTVGLILGMHGLGGDENQQVGSIFSTLSACKLSNEYMILGLKSKGNGWEEADHEPLSKAIAWALKNYPVDPRRVYAWGYSSGAFGVGRFTPRYQNQVTAGVMFAGGLWDPPKCTGDEQGLQLYLIHGDQDQTVQVKSSRDACEQLKANNYRYVYREVEKADHGLSLPCVKLLREGTSSTGCTPSAIA